MSDISHSTGGITLRGFLAAEVTVVVATSAFILLRIFANVNLHKRPVIDDCWFPITELP